MQVITSYLRLYVKYEEQLQINIKAYKVGLEARKVGLRELLIEAQIHKKDLNDLDKWFSFML